jgi:hypothetical protein
MASETQLQGINGSLSVTSRGYNFSTEVNLAGALSFAAATDDIQKALDADVPQAAFTTKSSIAPVAVSFTGSLVRAVLTVTNVSLADAEIGASTLG